MEIFDRGLQHHIKLNSYFEFQVLSYGCDWEHRVFASAHPLYLLLVTKVYPTPFTLC